MHLEKLNYVVEVAKTSSISLASKNLFITQSAISQAISNVEEELGVKLFSRARQGTHLTYEGEKIVEIAEEVLQKFHELKELSKSLQCELNGEIKVTTIAGLMPIVIENLSNFKTLHPNVDFMHSEKGSGEIIEDVLEGKCDIGLVHLLDNIDQKRRKLASGVLFKGQMLVSAQKNSPLASKKSITPEELLQENIVLYNDESILNFVSNFERKFGPLNILFISDNGEAVRRAVVEGLAITIAVDFTLQNSPNITSGKAITLPISNYEQPSIMFGWIYSERNILSVTIKEFITQLKTKFNKSNIKSYLYHE